jgi:molecular chaperone DnaK (HSP70)
MILGIDLGTCNTLAATITQDGHPILINDANIKDPSTPSLLLIEDKMALVGSMAEHYMDLYPEKNFIRFYKRYFGTQDPVFFDSKGNSWFSETLAAMMLKKIRFDAEMALPETAESVVITVPAHYNDAQRKSVIEAARLADINLKALVEEPVAAALSYMNTHAIENEIIMVYDFGGGTFDLTLITSNGNQVHVLAKDGLSNMGGKEFDEIISNRILEEYHRCFAKDIVQNVSTINKLRRVSENVKLGVCNSNSGWYNKWISFSENTFEFNMSLKEFEKKSEELIHTTQEVVNRCLRSVGISFKEVNQIVMVGGTSQIPFIKTYWQNQINANKQEIIYHNPFSSVALGAALYANSLQNDSGIKMPLELSSVSTYNIALGNKLESNKANDLLIYKNSPLPILAKRIYQLAPGKELAFSLMQYWDEKDVFLLGEIQIGPFDNTEVWTLELAIENRANGTIGVKLKNSGNGKDLKFNFEKEHAKYEYDATSQKKLLDDIIINNIY